MKQIAEIHITPSMVVLNGKVLYEFLPGTALGEAVTAESISASQSVSGKAMLTALYKQYVGDYPKYYKMDPLARLGFMASELLLQSVDEEHFVAREDRAIVLINRSASLAADRKYESTIQEGEEYFPSPADFVYTLPNIVTGEIAIRHQYHGETTFLVLEDPQEELLQSLIAQAFVDPMTQSVLGGWLECVDENHFEASLGLYCLEN